METQSNSGGRTSTGGDRIVRENSAKTDKKEKQSIRRAISAAVAWRELLENNNGIATWYAKETTDCYLIMQLVNAVHVWLGVLQTINIPSAVARRHGYTWRAVVAVVPRDAKTIMAVRGKYCHFKTRDAAIKYIDKHYTLARAGNFSQIYIPPPAEAPKPVPVKKSKPKKSKLKTTVKVEQAVENQQAPAEAPRRRIII